MTIDVETYAKIRRLKEWTDCSRREAVKKLHLSRNTIRKYWYGKCVPWERKKGTGLKKHKNQKENSSEDQ